MQVVRQASFFVLRVLAKVAVFPLMLLLTAGMGFGSAFGRAKPIRPDRVAIYIRWSTDDQASGTTLEVQRDGCENYLRSQGWTVRDDLVFIDEGFSGGNLDRPAITRLRELITQGEVDCVVVLKIDRLSRNIVDAVELVLSEWDGKCYLKSAREPIDTTQELGRMIFGILAMFADFERSQIKERTQGGKIRRIQAGKQMHGEPAYGYSAHPDQKGVWIENPKESPIVRRMFRMALDGLSINGISRQLNADGFRTRAGAPWGTKNVRWVLTNRTYIAEVEYGTTSIMRLPSAAREGVLPGTLAAKRARKRKVRVVNEVPIYSGPTDAVTALVSRETFDAVQERLAENSTQRKVAGSRGLASPYLLVGIARCPCGGPLLHKVQSGRQGRENRAKGKLYRHYICRNTRNGTCTADNGHIPGDAADRLVETVFLRLYGLKEHRLERFAPLLQGSEEDRRTVEAAIHVAEARLKELNQEERSLQRDARSGKVASADLGWLRGGISKDRDEVTAQLQALRVQLSAIEIGARSLEGTLSALGGADRWQSLQVWEKRQLLRMVLRERIVIRKAKAAEEIEIEPYWAF